MEPWLMYSLVASISVGMFNFMSKIQSEKGRIADMGFIFYMYFVQLILAGLFIFFGEKQIFYTTEVLLYAFSIIFIYTILIRTRLISLKYIESSTYFINYRLLSSILLVIIGISVFGDKISGKEFLGIAVGFIVFYLLLEKKGKNKGVKNIKKGFLYLFYGVCLLVSIQVIAKDFVSKSLDIPSLIFFEGLFGMFIAMFFIKGQDVRKTLTIGKKKDILFLLFSGILFTFGAYFNNLAFLQGDIAIVYKIISYSLFIPIILSIIFYKEKVSKKKIIAFLLTIVSIALFV